MTAPFKFINSLRTLTMPRSKLDYSYFFDNDPRRSPAWRYERVQRLLSSGKPPHPTRDDQHIQELRRYYLTKQRMRRSITDEYELNVQLAAKFGPIWCADRIFFNGRSDRTRYGLEALLLTRSDNLYIADESTVPPEAVDAYEAYFFNIRDRIDNRQYIASMVLMDAFMSGLGNRTNEMTAKYFAYYGGPIVLRLVCDGQDGAVLAPTRPDETERWLDGTYRHVQRAVANVGVAFMEPTTFTIRTLMEGYQSLLSLSYREQNVGGDDNVINQAMELFVKQNRVPLGDSADKLSRLPGPVYAGGQVEPRVSELLKLASGAVPPTLASYGDDWRPDQAEPSRVAAEADQ